MPISDTVELEGVPYSCIDLWNQFSRVTILMASLAQSPAAVDADVNSHGSTIAHDGAAELFKLLLKAQKP